MIPLETVIQQVTRNHVAGQTRVLFYGRGHTFEGWEDLNIYLFPPVVVIQVYRDDYPEDELAQAVTATLQNLSDPPQTVLVQRRKQRQDMWRLVHGTLPEQNLAQEGTLRYHLQFMEKQNIGFFPDMRLGRERAAQLAPGRKVLNLFSYTCSFSVVCMAAGAASCLNMDLSKAALNQGRKNHQLNNLNLEQVQFLGMDIFKSMGRIKRNGPYDLVIIDPPSNQEGFVAEKSYPRLIRRLPEFLSDGAHILACLNAPHLDSDFLKDLFPEPFQLQEKLGRPPEFAERDPERALKIQHYLYRAPHQPAL